MVVAKFDLFVKPHSIKVKSVIDLIFTYIFCSASVFEAFSVITEINIKT